MSQEENKDNKPPGMHLPLGRTDFGNLQMPPNLMPPTYLPHPNTT